MPVYMYSRYTDISDCTDADEERTIQNRTLHQRRDQAMYKCMVKEKIEKFPKSRSEFENVKIIIEDFAKKMPEQLILFFAYREGLDAPETKCLTLHKGEWKKFPDMRTATAEMLKFDPTSALVDEHHSVIDHKTRFKVE